MFQFIRRHQAIGLIFIGIVIVSFVIFFSPNQSGGGAGMGNGALGTIHGRPVPRGEYIAAMREVRLAHLLREGRWPGRGDQGFDEQQEVLTRLCLLEEARRLGVRVADDVAASRILDLPWLQDGTSGRFNAAAYDQFLAMIRNEEGMTRAEFEAFMRNEVALQHLVMLGGMSGTLVTPREAEARYRRGNDQYAGALVVFSATNYLGQVDLSPTNVTQYYSNRLAEYRIPERLQVRYVKFAATNFQSEAEQTLNSNTNLVRVLEDEYQRRGAESFRDPQGNVLAADAAQDQLKEQYLRSLSLDAARKKANEFANRLYQMEPSAGSLSKLAEETGQTAATSLPFDQFRPPLDLKVPSTFNRQAFALSEDEPFATPVVGEDAVYVVAFERRVPSEIQPFETVRERVTESLRRTQSRALAESAGRAFVAAATNGLAQGKAFAELAAEAGLNPITLTNFSRTTTALPEIGPRLTVSELVRAAGLLEPGKVGGFTPAADGGFVFFLSERSPAPDAAVQEALPGYLTQLRQMGRFTAFSDWQRRQFLAADVNFPGMGQSETNTAAAAN